MSWANNDCYSRGVSQGETVLRDGTDDELRNALLDAAAQVFSEEGYSGARVQQIATRAGLTTGAIYNRFSGKSELLLEALDRHTSAVVKDLSETEMSAADVLETVGVALLAEEGPASGLLLEAFMAARREEGVAERLRPRLAGERARLGSLVDSDKDAGLLDTELETDAIVTFCQAVALGMRMLSVIETPMPEASDWQQVIARLLAAMTPPSE